MLADSVSLPKTFEAWHAGKDASDIEEILDVELNGCASEILGGYNSDDEQVEILKLTLEEDRITAEIAIDFEKVTPSGCPDSPHETHCRVKRAFHMDSDLAEAVFEDDKSNPDEWEDIGDYNSAMDGQ